MKNYEKITKISKEILETIGTIKEIKATKYNNATLKLQMMRSIQIIDVEYKDMYKKMFVDKYKEFTSEEYVKNECCSYEKIIKILEDNLKKIKTHKKLLMKL